MVYTPGDYHVNRIQVRPSPSTTSIALQRGAAGSRMTDMVCIGDIGVEGNVTSPAEVRTDHPKHCRSIP